MRHETLIRQWRDDGFVVLPGFYSEADTEAAKTALAQAWREAGSRVVVDDLNLDQRLPIAEVQEAARSAHRFKVNDLYLESPSIRRLALNSRITPILKALLADTPVLCNSLNFLHGSSQADHVDSLYMTPRSAGHLLAIWVALEDCEMDAGPLRYYPGSHKIEQYLFSTGSNHNVPEEMPLWSSYMEEQVLRLGLKPQTFAAKRGDVFIWSAYLLHGGSPIRSPGKTRNSIVFHYFSEEDSRAIGARMVPMAGAYWMHRRHQPIPGRRIGSTAAAGSSGNCQRPAVAAAPVQAVAPLRRAVIRSGLHIRASHRQRSCPCARSRHPTWRVPRSR